MRDPREADARSHLSPGILRIVDRSGIRYGEMEPGQSVAVHAQDAVTHEPGSFLLRVISVRATNLGQIDAGKDVTFAYLEGDFNFHVHGGKGQDRTAQLKPGDLLESGVTAVFVPTTDYRMVYMGGIGVGRDHSFEYINGEDLTVVAHNIIGLDQGQAPADFKAPDVTAYLEKVRETERKAMKDRETSGDMARRVVMEDLETHFGDLSEAQAIKDLISGYSPNGQLVMSSFLIYGQEDGVLERAWEVLQAAHKKHFEHEHPEIRGDLDFKSSSVSIYDQMLIDVGIKWPRPTPKDLVIILPDERKAQLAAKLAEYQGRLESMPDYRLDTMHKVYVLQRLLEDGRIQPADLEAQIAEDLGPDFSRELFETAWLVMKGYCQDEGRNISGGTGLPKI